MDYPELTFEQPNREVFKNLDLAFHAMESGGTTACVLNATNEIAVDAFLNDKISFSEIAMLNNDVVKSANIIAKPLYEDYVSADREARESALKLIQ